MTRRSNMVYRLIRWLLVALIATAIVVVLYRLAQPEGPDDHANLGDRGVYLALADTSTNPGKH